MAASELLNDEELGNPRPTMGICGALYMTSGDTNAPVEW